jgi:hypothetical protein
MAKGLPRKFGVTCGALLLANTIIAAAYLYFSVPQLLMSPWLLSGSGFCSLFGL